MSLDKNMTILVVDDYSTMRKMIKNILTQSGFTKIIEADKGTTAFAKLKAEKINLVIADWNMPEMNGLELLKNIRGDANLKGTPMLMVTAESTVANVITAVKAGVNSYIIKPFDANTLLDKINRIFNEVK